MFDKQIFTPSDVRLRRHGPAVDGGVDWLLLPGGPGLGSESLTELADIIAGIEGSGSVYLVDLPGDGSNIDPPVPADVDERFAKWPGVLIEAAEAVPGAVFAGHSTGGMYLLSTPGLAGLITGLVLISSAPNANWLAAFAEMTRRHPLPAVDSAAKAYGLDPTPSHLRDLTVASAEWNFTPPTVDYGQRLLKRLPYNVDAVDWSDRNFDHTYAHQWLPDVPTLILSGGEDRIVDQSLWDDDPSFSRANILHRTIPNGAHFPWIDQPDAVRECLMEFVGTLELE